jgi:dihydrodipicolinate synthase/N-acetylneuraminate lyase
MSTTDLIDTRTHLLNGQAIPALPLALDEGRHWSERYQRALLRYYMDAGTGGIAVGVHSTQFEIRDDDIGLFEPLLELAAGEIKDWIDGSRPYTLIAGICGTTEQALDEANTAIRYGYHAGLLSLAALKDSSIDKMLEHCRAVADTIPLVGFYLQPAVGGRVLPYDFWRQFAEIPNVLAIKIAPFNRYQTFDVVRATMEAGRDDIALYTGNDDNIATDLLTRWQIGNDSRFIVGGLLGQFGVWTKRAVELLNEIKTAREADTISAEWLTRNAAWTDANAAVFDAANGFAGCIPGIHEVLRRQGLLPTTNCLNPDEVLSPGQEEELDRVEAAYPWLLDNDFVRENLDRWLK